MCRPECVSLNAPLIARYVQGLLVSRRHTVRTVTNYERDLARLSDFASAGGVAFVDIDMHCLRRCIVQLAKSGLHGKSIAHALSVWRGFYAWLHTQGLVKANPAVGLRAPRTAKPLPKALSVDDAVRLAEFQSPDSAAGIRDHAMIEVLYSCALRRAELVSLDYRYLKTPTYESRSWLDVVNGEVQVLGKGSKRRVVPMGSKALMAIALWIDERANYLKPSSSEDAQAALFLGAHGERINAGVVHARIRSAALQAGIASSVHPHMLRHSAASHVLQSSGDLRAVQEFLGHANIATTQIYTKLDWQHLAGFYDAAHPRAKR